MMKKIAVTAATLVALLALGYFVTLVAIKPISSDLSVIGQGRPALVLAYENYSPTGGEALDRLRRVRGDYESRLDFVVADLGTPQGQAFANRYQLIEGQVVFLDKHGQPVQVITVPADEQELRSRLDERPAVNGNPPEQ